MENSNIDHPVKNPNNIDLFYREYYQSITNLPNKKKVQFVILTHIVSDVTEFISAISGIGEISIIISIPYSKDQKVYELLSGKYKMITPTLDNLLDEAYLKKLVLTNIDLKKQLIIVEIGGYFSSVINDIYSELGGNLIGVVEDTESGHRKYELIDKKLPCPVLSVARSSLKDAENFLVSSSCLQAVNKLIKALDFKLDIKNPLVLGYGKIGQGVCQMLKDDEINVNVYDIDSSKRLLALSRGFKIPEKKYALSNADALFGSSGVQSVTKDDVKLIKNGCVLFSCSSKQVEFDLNYIKEEYKKTFVHENLDKYENSKNYFYIAGDGYPINFAAGKILVGPLISIVHGEMLLAISEIIISKCENKLQEISDEKKSFLAKKWIGKFCNSETGEYCY